jgi:murein DD-endopeptidase MepM/ murein hydrolase activator NlpD
MLQKPYRGDYRFSLEFGKSYGGILGLGNKPHEGLDVAMPCGTPIFAPADGFVHKSNDCAACSDYGLYLELEIGNLWVRLAHLSKINVKTGDKVTAGQQIGWSGNTGKSTGCHLHTGIHDLTKHNEPMHDYQNPREYMDFGEPSIPDPVPEPKEADTPFNEIGGRYVVQKGDSLWRIAARIYGRGSQWPKIFEVNKDQIKDPNLIQPGQIIRLP